MRALVVGAGAVGQVYGAHLQRGGAEVTFFVKEKYLDACRAGFQLYPLNRPRAQRAVPVAFQGFGCVSQVEAGNADFDQVWLCVSATALEGDWLAQLLAASGPSATVVCLPPGLDSLERITSLVSPTRVVQGLISLVSYQVPLPGSGASDPGPGVAYWFPPLSPTPISGIRAGGADAKARAEAAAAALRAGGCPAGRVEDAGRSARRGSAVLMPHLAALELEAWSLTGLRRSALLKTAAAASREALRVVSAYAGDPLPAARFALRPSLMRALLVLAPRAVPFPLEPYLAYHFTKVGDQTRAMMRLYVDEGRRRGLRTTGLERLLGSLERRDQPPNQAAQEPRPAAATR